MLHIIKIFTLKTPRPYNIKNFKIHLTCLTGHGYEGILSFVTKPMYAMRLYIFYYRNYPLFRDFSNKDRGFSPYKNTALL